jgi:hypothetical protein
MERILRDTGDALTGWYEQWHGGWEKKSKNEVLISGVLLDDTIRLTGKLDKLECVGGPSSNPCKEVRVVDYKTGRPKSRNEIEGTTKSAQKKPGAGGYKRQLVFYKLQYQMQEAMLDFIEPNPSGKFKRESFVIDIAEVEDLKDEVRRVAQEIHELSFWDSRCEDTECEACALRDVMEG